MTPENFKREWTDAGDTLIPFTRESLDGIHIPESSIRLLAEAGLPDSASPFLDFFGHGSRRLQPASDAYSLDSEFAHYLCIGTNDAGDPICIDTESNGAIVLLFHDDNFRRIQMNSSVEKLAESLLKFRNLVDQTCALNGEDAFLDGDIPKHLIEKLTSELNAIDADVMNNRDFWPTEINTVMQSAV